MKSTLPERLQTVLRTGELSALHKEALRVPRESTRGRAPKGPCRLAAQYLLEESRLRRREVTILADRSAPGPRIIDVECALPDVGWGKKTWYLPLAFFPKTAVAPDLEVTDEEGKVIPIPTKDQNFAFTEKAIDELIERGKLDSPSSKTLWDLGHEVVTSVPHHARVCRFLFEQMVTDKGEFIRLLRLLEENFVLWVPVEGTPSSQHHFRIARQEIYLPDAMIVKSPVRVTREYETAVGQWLVELNLAIGRPRIRRRAVFDRVTQALAIRSIEATVYELESGRATSAHLRVSAPSGFVVRNIRLGERVPTPGGYPQVEEIYQQENVVIQGWDQALGHVHLSKPQNPDQTLCKVTLGPKEGVITLWTLATLLSAALIWIVHHHVRYGPLIGLNSNMHPHFQWTLAQFGQSGGATKRLSGEGESKQIAAAVLLVGPAFVSAWSLRAEGGELMRSFLSGARILLLSSATLAIATALSLAGILPTAFDEYTTVEFYAMGSYLVAVPMVAALLLTNRATWVAFRWVLNTERRNLQVILFGALALAAVGAFSDLPPRVAGFIIAGLGLGLACIAANSAAEPLRLDRSGTLYRPLAASGALLAVVFAGSLLGFYADLVPFWVARRGCIGLGVILALFALYGRWRVWKQAEEGMNAA